VSSEDNIVATFDVIADVLLNIFGLLDTVLRHWNPQKSPAVSEQRQHNVLEDMLLGNTVDYKMQKFGNEHSTSTSFNCTVRLTEG
jgi:hypothetical protein